MARLVAEERFAPLGQGIIWHAVEPLKIYKFCGQQLLATVPKGLFIEELEKQGDWIRHHKGWSPITEHGKVVLWPLNSHDKSLWFVTKDVNIRNKPNFNASSVTGRLSAGVIFEEVAKDGIWIQHSKGWSVTYSEKEKETHIVPLTPLPHEQREHLLQLKAQSAPKVSLPPQTYYQPPGMQPQVQVLYAPVPIQQALPVGQVIYVPQPVYQPQGSMPPSYPQGVQIGQPPAYPQSVQIGQPVQPQVVQPIIPIYGAQGVVNQPPVTNTPAQQPSVANEQPHTLAYIPNIMDQEVPLLKDENKL